MPSVPYNPVPTVQPTGLGAPSMSEAGATPDAFGAQVGRATERLGGEVEKFGNIMAHHAIKMAEDRAHAEAKDAFFNATVESGEVETQFRSLQGKAAVDAYPKYVEDLKAVKDKHAESLGNSYAKKIFDSDFTRRLGLSIIDGSRYAATQNKKFVVDSNKSVMDIAERDIALYPQDNDRFDQNLKLAQSSLNRITFEANMDEGQKKLRSDDVTNNLWQTRLGALARIDLEQTKTLYEANKNKLTPEGRVNVEDAILKQTTAAKSKAAVDRFSTNQLVDGDIASVRQTGVGNPNLTEQKIAETLGPDKAEEWKFKRGVAEGVWRSTHDMVGMTGGEINERLTSMEPKGDPGSPDYLRKLTVYQGSIEYANGLQKLRETDPAASVGEDVSVKSAIAAAKKNDPASMKAIFDARMAAQERAGVVNRSPITIAEAQQYIPDIYSALRQREGDEKAAIQKVADKMKSQYGDYWQPAFSFALRAMNMNVEQSQAIGNIVGKLLSNAPLTEKDGAAIDAAKEKDAVEPIKKPSERVLQMFPKKGG